MLIELVSRLLPQRSPVVIRDVWPTLSPGQPKRQRLTLLAFNHETNERVECDLDLARLHEADKMFKRFARHITHKGFVLEGAH